MWRYFLKNFYFPWKLYKSDTNRNDGNVLLPPTTGSAEESSETGALHLASPLLPQSVRKYSEDLRVQQLCLLQPRQLLSQFHLQTVTSAVFPLQMLDGADASGGRKRRAQLLLAPACQHTPQCGRANLNWPDTMMATRSHTASASSM